MRVAQVARLAPVVTEAALDAILAQDLSRQQLHDLVRLLFLRFKCLYPDQSFEENMQRVLRNKVMAVFHACPALVEEMRGLLVTTISSSSFSSNEMVLHLCWLVGEHADAASVSAIREFHQALELFTYERLSMARIAVDQVFQSRLILILISCLSKLAARDIRLIPRVVLCLTKVHGQKGFHDAVYARCRECVRLLQMPHIATAVFGSSNPYAGGQDVRYDSLSSVAMLQKPRSQGCEAIPL